MKIVFFEDSIPQKRSVPLENSPLQIGPLKIDQTFSVTFFCVEMGENSETRHQKCVLSE